MLEPRVVKGYWTETGQVDAKCHFGTLTVSDQQEITLELLDFDLPYPKQLEFHNFVGIAEGAKYFLYDGVVYDGRNSINNYSYKIYKFKIRSLICTTYSVGDEIGSFNVVKIFSDDLLPWLEQNGIDRKIPEIGSNIHQVEVQNKIMHEITVDNNLTVIFKLSSGTSWNRSSLSFNSFAFLALIYSTPVDFSKVSMDLNRIIWLFSVIMCKRLKIRNILLHSGTNEYDYYCSDFLPRYVESTDLLTRGMYFNYNELRNNFENIIMKWMTMEIEIWIYKIFHDMLDLRKLSAQFFFRESFTLLESISKQLSFDELNKIEAKGNVPRAVEFFEVFQGEDWVEEARKFRHEYFHGGPQNGERFDNTFNYSIAGQKICHLARALLLCAAGASKERLSAALGKMPIYQGPPRLR